MSNEEVQAQGRRDETSRRIEERIRAHAERVPVGSVPTRGAVWGRLFGVFHVEAGRLAPADVQHHVTVASAVRSLRDDRRDAEADLLIYEALRKEARGGPHAEEAKTILRAGREEVSRRASIGERVPVRDFFTCITGKLKQRSRNGLHSHLMKQKVIGPSDRERFRFIVLRLHSILQYLYDVPGPRTLGEKAAGVNKRARFPKAMLEDIAFLFATWAPEFGHVKPQMVRAALRL